MHLICPHCGKAHLVKAQALGPEGRNVRCAACKKVWFTTPAGEAVMVARQPIPQALLEKRQSAPNPKPVKTAWHKRFYLPRIKINTPTVDPGVAMICGLVVCLCAGFTFRESVVRNVPDLAGLFASAGMKVNVRALEFADLISNTDVEDGQPVITVEGKVINPTGSTVNVPPIRVAMRGPTGAELIASIVRTDHEQLAAKSEMNFKTRLANPPQDAKDILVRFSARDGGGL